MRLTADWPVAEHQAHDGAAPCAPGGGTKEQNCLMCQMIFQFNSLHVLEIEKRHVLVFHIRDCFCKLR